jgi:hypothetical protein
LISLMELRLLASFWQIESVHLEDGFAVCRYTVRSRIEQLARASGKRLRVVDHESAYLPLPAGLTDPDAICGVIKALLRSA